MVSTVMGGKSSRAKGHAFERWVAAQLRPFFPNARRGLQTQARGKDMPPDVVNCPWPIECKVGKNPPTRPALYKTMDNHGANAVVVIKQDYAQPLVILSKAALDSLDATERLGPYINNCPTAGKLYSLYKEYNPQGIHFPEGYITTFDRFLAMVATKYGTIQA